MGNVFHTEETSLNILSLFKKMRLMKRRQSMKNLSLLWEQIGREKKNQLRFFMKIETVEKHKKKIGEEQNWKTHSSREYRKTAKGKKKSKLCRGEEKFKMKKRVVIRERKKKIGSLCKTERWSFDWNIFLMFCSPFFHTIWDAKTSADSKRFFFSFQFLRKTHELLFQII